MTKINFVGAEIFCEEVMITSSVAKITSVVAEITFEVAVIPAAKITFEETEILFSWLTSVC